MRKLITILVMLAMAGLGLVACGSEQNASENWTPITLLDGVVKNIPCDQRESADRQINAAINEQDEDALSVLKLLTDDGKLNDDKVADVRKDLENLKVVCTARAVDATDADCPGGTPLKYDPNKELKVKSDGIENVNDILKIAEEDPRALAYYLNDKGLFDDVNDWRLLTQNEGKCRSSMGDDSFNMLKGAMIQKGTKVDTNTRANPNWYNTGMNASGPVVNPVNGIEGNLDAITITFPDGHVMVILKRCGNLALPAAPKSYTPVHIPGSRKPTPPGTGGPPPTNPPTNPPPTTTPPLNPKGTEAPLIPGQPGARGDGGDSKYGGNGDSRGTATGPATPPGGGNPPVQQPAPQPKPDPAPVPSANPAPPNWTPPPVETPAPPPTNPGGSGGCGPGTQPSDC